MTVKARIYDSVEGGWIEIGTIAVDPASAGAGVVVSPALTITGAKAGDVCFMQPADAAMENLTNLGAVVTADTVTLRLLNGTAGTIDGASRTWNYYLLHLS